LRHSTQRRKKNIAMHEAAKMRFEQEMRTNTPLTMQDMEAYKEGGSIYDQDKRWKQEMEEAKEILQTEQKSKKSIPFFTTKEQKKFYKLRSCFRISKENKGLRFGLVAKICDKE
jgi:hypothetical protein